MVTLNPRFWATPIRYCRWAARERPNYFWPIVIGACSPLTFVVGPPIRKLLGDENPPTVPMTYPGAYRGYSCGVGPLLTMQSLPVPGNSSQASTTTPTTSNQIRASRGQEQIEKDLNHTTAADGERATIYIHFFSDFIATHTRMAEGYLSGTKS